MTRRADILADIKECENLVRTSIEDVDSASQRLEDAKDILLNLKEDLSPDDAQIDSLKTILDDLVDLRDSYLSLWKSLPPQPEKIKMESCIFQDDLWNIIQQAKSLIG